MSITHFASAPAAAVIALADYSVTDDVVDPADALAKFTLVDDGTLSADGIVAPAFAGDEWSNVQQSGIGDLYEARATLVSGQPPDGDVLGSWLPLSTSRSWSQEQLVIGAQTTVIDVEIGYVNANSALTTGRITLNVSVLAP